MADSVGAPTSLSIVAFHLTVTTERRMMMWKSLNGSTSLLVYRGVLVVRWFPMYGGFLCAVYNSTRLAET
jgi:hypothetical protein